MWTTRKKQQHLWAALALALGLLGAAKADRSSHTRVTSEPGDSELQADQGHGGVSEGGIQTIALKIKIPESTEVVTTDVALDSGIPDCVRKDPSSVDENGGITVMAEVFTDCAKKELRRIQDELDMVPANVPSSGPRGKSDKAVEPQDSGPVAAGVPSQGREIDQDGAQNNSKRQDRPPYGIPEHERVNQGILAQHGTQGSDNSTGSKDAAGAIANATVHALRGSGSTDMLAVLQTVFDYKRVMNDLRRILRGDVFGVLGEYPGRMTGLFKMVQELPRRIVRSIGIVSRLRSETTDTTFRGVLTNLKEYLTQASHTAKDLPTAFTLVSVMDTLRNVAYKIGDGTGQHAEQRPVPPPAQRALLTRVEELLRNPLGEVFNMEPYGKIAQETGQGGQLLARRVFDFHPKRFIPGGFDLRNIFHRRHYQPPAQQPEGTPS